MVTVDMHEQSRHQPAVASLRLVPYKTAMLDTTCKRTRSPLLCHLKLYNPYVLAINPIMSVIMCAGRGVAVVR
jgi:hypothetical protein